MGQIKVLFPLTDGEEIWLEFKMPGFHGRFFGTVDKEPVNSELIVAGKAIPWATQ